MAGAVESQPARGAFCPYSRTNIKTDFDCRIPDRRSSFALIRIQDCQAKKRAQRLVLPEGQGLKDDWEMVGWDVSF